MFNVDPAEFLLVAFVALVVIGPKDLPKAMRVIGYWVGRARAVGRQFRAGFDEMVREAELEEMEKKWKEENERIMREHPLVPPPPSTPALEHAPDGDHPSLEQPSHAGDPALEHGSHGGDPSSPEHASHGDDPANSSVTPDDGDAQRPVMVEQPQVVPTDPASPPPPPADTRAPS